MNPFRWIGRGSHRVSDPTRRPRSRSLTSVKPACEALDGRQLLSSGVSAATLAVLSPPATAVAMAAADLTALDPTTFARYQSALAKVESRSRITAAQIDTLGQDVAAIDQAIQSAGLDADSTSSLKNHAQDVADAALVQTPSQAASKRLQLDQYLSSIPGVVPLVRQTVHQMQVVAAAARVGTPLHNDFSSANQILTSELGPSPDTDLGPGARDRDPLVVYFNGQIGGFVKG
jgi:hypothetical protein